MKQNSQFCFKRRARRSPRRARLRMHLYDQNGLRKYLTPTERRSFLDAAETCGGEVHTFCGTLTYTGCRISEALALTAARVDIEDGLLIFESLKKRRKGIFRAVPAPSAFLETLARVHDLQNLKAQTDRGVQVRLWPWSRTTAWRRVCEVMDAANIAGLHAMPKGLRHGFGIKAVTSSVPLNMTQKWLGHAQISTTAIYTNAIGQEEREMAARMWA